MRPSVEAVHPLYTRTHSNLSTAIVVFTKQAHYRGNGRSLKNHPQKAASQSRTGAEHRQKDIGRAWTTKERYEKT